MVKDILVDLDDTLFDFHADERAALEKTFKHLQIPLNDAVREAADALADGEFSEVIEAESGYYVVYMESTYDEDATESKRQSVLTERERAAYDEWYTPLSEAAEITTNDEAIQKLTFERVFNVPAEQQ